ncbi:MAG: OmpA family protein [Candidatus Kapabacteria bacterium]|jgi:outer membrane protein OmpA-like peptidoglycan-associated protein|nr:OmpA family protein [Candidatus Kapabacteria bacterium]
MKSRSQVSLYAAWILGFLIIAPFVATHPRSAIYAQTPVAKADTVDASVLKLGLLDEIMVDADKPMFIRYGIFGGVNVLNEHLADFASFGFQTDAINFGRSAANFPLKLSLNFGGLFEYQLIDRFGFGIRASYTQIGDSLKSFERILAAGVQGGSPTVTNIQRTLFLPNLALIAGEPYLKYHPIDFLSVSVGVRFGFAINRAYNYSENIAKEFRFVDNGTSDTARNRQAGEVPLNSPIISLIGGLCYEIPLDPGGKWLLAIEGFYAYGISQMANNLSSRKPQATFNNEPSSKVVPRDQEGTDRDPLSEAWPRDTSGTGSWLFNNLRAGLSLRYSPFRTIRPELTPQMQETFKQIKRIDSAIAVERAQNQKRLAQVDSINKAISQRVEELKKVGISVNITKVVGIDESGKEIPGKAKLVVEQFRKSVTQPVLPAIFFDEGSFTIPSKYRKLKSADRGTFKMGDLVNKSNYEVYRHILNIVGKRMEENPAAVLFVTGCNANVGSEQGNQKLSEQRAQAVSDYLQDVWKVQAKRIIIQKRDLPEVPSNSADAAGAAENRRVDLSSTLPELLAPVVSDVVAKIPNPPTIRFGIEINAGAGLKQWNLEATQFQDDEVATVFQRTGTNTYPPQLDWNLAQDLNTVPSSGQDLTIQLSMTDINNKTGDAPLTSIPVEQINIQKKELEGKDDKRIDWFDIVGFTGGANPALDETNQKTIEAIKAKLKPESTITISAYTDNTGDAAQNKQLAQQRADFIAKAIGTTKAKINAVGPTTLHDNNNPEGRMYNRMVRVEVLSPAK